MVMLQGTYILLAQLQLLDRMYDAHVADSDTCFLAPNINIFTYLPCRVLEYSIRYSTEYSSSKKLDSPSPTLPPYNLDARH